MSASVSVIKPTVKWTVLAVSLWLSGCSNHTPAPVTSLGKDYHSLERGSYRGSYYEVQKGDTLYFISYITDKDVNDLVAYNQLTRPYTIFPGQKLQLWKPKYQAPQYGKTVPITSPSTQTVHKAKPVITPVAKPTSKPTVAPASQTASKAVVPPVNKPASQKPVAVAATKPATVQKNSNKNIDPAPTKEYSQKAESNKVVTNKPKPKPSNTKVDKWTWPTKGRVIARFSNAENGNKGLDIAGQRGQAIEASADGVVVYAGNALRGYGNLVIIKHSEDFLSAYAHNDQMYVKEQQRVKVGQKIATMGSSGTNNVRLHFEIRYKGKSVDPMRYLPR
ncbi:peptidoglycan DD-metalloendopeptidase family protein [Photobacterium japonica]|uniref:peptidoglycan DD-metalloendopeptidase family protein n=1 Tax=Photobacterium japonica TaxID=2910235 RepID=UPI003D0CBF23